MILKPKVAKPLSSKSWHLHQRWKICFFFQMKIAAGLEPRDVINYPKIHNKERIQAESDFRKQPSHVEYISTLSKWLLLQLKNIVTSIGVSASRRGKFPSLHLRYLHRLGVNNRPPPKQQCKEEEEEAELHTATKETRKATRKQWRTTSKSNKKPCEKKKQQRNCLCLYLLFFTKSSTKSRTAKHLTENKNTRLGQNFQNPKKKSKHITR